MNNFNQKDCSEYASRASKDNFIHLFFFLFNCNAAFKPLGILLDFFEKFNSFSRSLSLQILGSINEWTKSHSCFQTFFTLIQTNLFKDSSSVWLKNQTVTFLRRLSSVEHHLPFFRGLILIYFFQLVSNSNTHLHPCNLIFQKN